MNTDNFVRFQEEADGMIGHLPIGYEAWLGYRLEVFNVEEWADIDAWDEDDDCPIALCKTYTDSFNITFEARGYLSEDDHFIRYEKLKLRIVEDDGWYELVDSVPSAYLRMMLRSTFNRFLASKSKLNVKTEDEWTWLARPFG